MTDILASIYVLGVPVAFLLGLKAAADDSFDFLQFVLGAMLAAIGAVFWPITLTLLIAWAVFR
ncbi:membrane protein [Mycobacterium phage Nanosmite]|nr:membrane protein [Mycobacterium phage Nanosmite]